MNIVVSVTFLYYCPVENQTKCLIASNLMWWLVKPVRFSFACEPGSQKCDNFKACRGHFCTGNEYFKEGNRPKVEEFFNGRSYLLWEVLGLDHSDTKWMEKPVKEWAQDPSYAYLHRVTNTLTVVNDPAERMIRLVAERISMVRSEDRLQDTLLSVAELQRLLRDFRRGHFSKELLSRVLDRMLEKNLLDEEEEQEDEEEPREEELGEEEPREEESGEEEQGEEEPAEEEKGAEGEEQAD